MKLMIQRLFYILVTGILVVTQGHAQNAPTTAGSVPTISPAIVNPVPAAYSSPTINYVRSWVPQQPITNPTDVIDAARTVTEVSHATQYLDGLGRPLQTVNWQASPDKKDLVAATLYDDLGEKYTNTCLIPPLQRMGNLQPTLLENRIAFTAVPTPPNNPLTPVNRYTTGKRSMRTLP